MAVRFDLGRTLATVQTEFDRLSAERRQLLELVNKPRELSESAVTAVLRDALDNKAGWREHARRVLGIERMMACKTCSALFPSGGHRKLYCGEPCRLANYKLK